MDSNAIKNIIEKYFEGESSLEEEKQLRDYFNRSEVKPELKVYKPLFQYFEAEQASGLGDTFDEKLLAKLDVDPAQPKIRKLSAQWAKAAAVIAFIFASFWLIQKNYTPEPQDSWAAYEETDPQKAYEETMKALALVSNKFNKSSQKAVEEISRVNKINKVLQ